MGLTRSGEIVIAAQPGRPGSRPGSSTRRSSGSAPPPPGPGGRPWSTSHKLRTMTPTPGGALRGESSGRIHDLPERVLPHDLVAAERPDVAAPDLQPVARGGGAGERPLGHAAITAHEVGVLAVVDVRDAL